MKAELTTTEIIDGKAVEIEWRQTGKVLSRICIHDSYEIIEGDGSDGNTYQAGTDISCGEIVGQIDDIEKID